MEKNLNINLSIDLEGFSKFSDFTDVINAVEEDIVGICIKYLKDKLGFKVNFIVLDDEVEDCELEVSFKAVIEVSFKAVITEEIERELDSVYEDFVYELEGISYTNFDIYLNSVSLMKEYFVS